MESQFDEFDKENLPYRRDLLPWWVKVFSWIFIVFGGLSIINFFILIFGVGIDASLYGLAQVLPHPYAALLILSIMIFNGVTGLLLWYEKENAILVGQICAAVGIIVCLISMALSIGLGDFTFRLEIIFIGLFLNWLNKIKFEWEEESRPHTKY